MHVFSVNRKIDYSIPVVFKLLADPQKPAAIITQKTSAPAKPVVHKAQQKAVANVPKKETIVATPSAKPAAKKESFDTPPRGTQDERRENKKVEIEKPKIEEKKSAPEVKKDIPALAAAAPKPVNTHVSDNYREVEAIRRTAQLQKELVQQWHPPVGVPAGCTCDVSFFVTKKGIIEKVTITKSSGIMMFDISARQALFSMKMPQWTYGKSLTISFK